MPLDTILVKGGAKLDGEVRVSGAKNAALPILASSLLTAGAPPTATSPTLGDVAHDARLLRRPGRRRRGRARGTCHVDARRRRRREAPYELVKTMRASVLVLGPLVARHGRARVSLPGRLRDRRAAHRPAPQGARGDGGARSTLEQGYVHARARRLRGRDDRLRHAHRHRHREPDDGGGAREGPHDARELRRASPRSRSWRGCSTRWARASAAPARRRSPSRASTSCTRRPRDHPRPHRGGDASWSRRPSRGGDVLVKDAVPEHLEAVIAKLRAAGVEVTVEAGGMRVRGRAEIKRGRTSRPRRTPASPPTCRPSSWC